MKIFCIGDSRTATTSFHEHAIQLGLKSIHHYDFIFSEKKLDKNTTSREDLYICLKEFIDNSGYQCFSDYPTRNYFLELSRDYPNALFVNTVRSTESWISSCKNYFHKAGLDVNYNKLLENHNLVEEQIKSNFDQADNFLEINICEEDPYQVSIKLNKFLGFPSDSVIIGHHNQSMKSNFGGVTLKSLANPAIDSIPKYDLEVPSNQFELYCFKSTTLSDLLSSLSKRDNKAILSEYGHAFLINDSTCGAQKILNGEVVDVARPMNHFVRRKKYLAAQGCKYILFIVPEKVSLAHHLLPKAFNPFKDEIADNILNKRLAHKLSESLDFCYDTTPYLQDVHNFSNILFRFDSHLNGLGCFYLYKYISEILKSTVCPEINNEFVDKTWLARIGTWNGDLLNHLSKEEFSLVKHAWRRNSKPLKAFGKSKPSEQFIEYYIKDESALNKIIDPLLHELHPSRSQYKFVNMDTNAAQVNACFIHDSAIDKLYQPFASTFRESYFYWNAHKLPPDNHQSFQSGNLFVEVYQERFLYSL